MKIIYAGNRSFALKSLGKKLKNQISVVALKNSFLAKYADTNNYPLKTFSSKNELYEFLIEIKNKTLFISCGVPFKINVNQFPLIAFINIHPSLLPNLKGRDPAIGLLTQGGKQGVTIHQMNMDIDSGYILWQSNPLDVEKEMNIKDIYSLSFILEEKAGEEICSQINSYGLNSFIDKFLKTLKVKTNPSIIKEGSYFNRSPYYGLYKDIFSNNELINHIRSASLNNYGTKAKLLGKSIEIEIIIDSCNLIKNNNLKFLELFNFSKKVDFQECTILYILENRVCVLRKSQILLFDLKNKINIQYQFDNENILHLKEIK